MKFISRQVGELGQGYGHGQRPRRLSLAWGGEKPKIARAPLPVSFQLVVWMYMYLLPIVYSSQGISRMCLSIVVLIDVSLSEINLIQL